MILKPSKFNFTYRKDNETVVYNTFSKACVILDDKTIPLIQEQVKFSESNYGL